MSEEAVVRIGSQGVTLTLSRPERFEGRVERFWVDLDMDRGLHASHRVLASFSERLPAFFGGLAANWRGWDGAKTLRFAEYGPDAMELTATHDGVGHVLLRVELGKVPPYKSYESGWAVTANVVIEPGSLGQIAEAVATLLGE